MTSSLETLQELAGELRALLDQIGPENPQPSGWESTWGRCQELFEAYRANEPDAGSLDPDASGELVQTLEDVVRLNAVAVSLVCRESERLSGDLRRLAEVKRHVRTTAAAAAPTGGSCDLSG
ncbi:MAG: hypothetical protein AAF682_08835 [Planctomycetota bacterium]